jgi:hypothetical protein
VPEDDGTAGVESVPGRPEPPGSRGDCGEIEHERVRLAPTAQQRQCGVQLAGTRPTIEGHHLAVPGGGHQLAVDLGDRMYRCLLHRAARSPDRRPIRRFGGRDRKHPDAVRGALSLPGADRLDDDVTPPALQRHAGAHRTPGRRHLAQVRPEQCMRLRRQVRQSGGVGERGALVDDDHRLAPRLVRDQVGADERLFPGAEHRGQVRLDLPADVGGDRVHQRAGVLDLAGQREAAQDPPGERLVDRCAGAGDP